MDRDKRWKMATQADGWETSLCTVTSPNAIAAAMRTRVNSNKSKLLELLQVYIQNI